MSQTAKLSCTCGEVQGRVSNASRYTVNRVVCYCDDCQAFLHHLKRADLLDAHGGADIVQVAPGSLRIEQGAGRVVGLRLSPRGLFRWHTDCCNTPIGNTLEPSIPFIGLPAQIFTDADQIFGAPVGRVRGEYAIGEPPRGSKRASPLLLLRTLGKIAGWRLRGLHRPHPYFDAAGAPTQSVSVLPLADRQALRGLCGPAPVNRARVS